MDYAFFLKERTKFIRMLYAESCTPFTDRLRKIEAEEPPFEPRYSEDGEPAFLTEWIEAHDAGLILGEACISMLSASFKLFISERLRYVVQLADDGKRLIKKLGLLRAYRAMLAEIGFPIDGEPFDYALLEEIELVRNAAQHPAHLTSIVSSHSAHSRKRIPSPIFISDSQRDMLLGLDATDSSTWLMPPRIEITPEKMEQAIHEVERFCEWFDIWLRNNEAALRKAVAKAATDVGNEK